MVYRPDLQRYDPQGYNNWGSNNSTPNNQADHRRASQTPPSSRPPIANSSGRQTSIYNSFLSNYGETSTEGSRDPPSSTDRNKKVLFSKQLEIHEKQKTPKSATPATPILRSGVRARNLAPTPVHGSNQKFSGRDPTPRVGNRPLSGVKPEKRKTIHDLLNELPHHEPGQKIQRSRAGSEPPPDRSRRPQHSNSIKSPRDIFSKMALRAAQSEIKAKVQEPEAAQTLLRPNRLSHEDDHVSGRGWDIAELFPSTPHDAKKQSKPYRTPSSIEELLSQSPPPPPPLPSEPSKSASQLKAYESRDDHWDAADLYSDSWNRYLQDKSPSNASTESQDAFLISRHQPDSNGRGVSSQDSSSSDIRRSTSQQRRSAARKAKSETKTNGSKNSEPKAGYGYERPREIRGNKLGDSHYDTGYARNVSATEGGRKLDFGTLLGRESAQDPTVSFEQCRSLESSSEENLELNKKSTDDTSETDWANELIARKNLSRSMDDESNESPETYNGNFNLPRYRGHFNRKWQIMRVVLCCATVGLVIGLPVYFFDLADPKTTTATTPALKFDRCVEGPPDSTSYSSRYTNIRKIIMGTAAGEPGRVDEAGSPQRKALCWLADVDSQVDSDGAVDIPAIVQRYTMAVIYYTLVPEGDESERSLSQSDYLSSKHECEWSVVICTSPKTVSSLLLADKLLTGPLPAEIASLVNLSFLELSLNGLSADIPTSIEKLTLLEYLSVAFNSFSGTIPTEIGKLSKLEFLNMQSSQVHGTIPTEFGGLSQLEILLLEGNWLSGTIPEHLGNLGRAQQISLRENYLTGRVSSELCELRDMSLTELKVDSWIECDCCTA